MSSRPPSLAICRFTPRGAGEVSDNGGPKTKDPRRRPDGEEARRSRIRSDTVSRRRRREPGCRADRRPGTRRSKRQASASFCASWPAAIHSRRGRPERAKAKRVASAQLTIHLGPRGCTPRGADQSERKRSESRALHPRLHLGPRGFTPRGADQSERKRSESRALHPLDLHTICGHPCESYPTRAAASNASGLT